MFNGFRQQQKNRIVCGHFPPKNYLSKIRKKRQSVVCRKLKITTVEKREKSRSKISQRKRQNKNHPKVLQKKDNDTVCKEKDTRLYFTSCFQVRTFNLLFVYKIERIQSVCQPKT